jgi:hypothetical protein
LIAFTGEDHDDESARPNVVDMVAQMLVLLDRAGEAKQRPLELSQESVFLSSGIETTDVFVTVQDVDILSSEPGMKQRIDGGMSAPGVCDGSHDPIGGIWNEILGFRRCGFHGSSDPNSSASLVRCSLQLDWR